MREKVIWHQGQRVSPIHFQQQDRYFESLINRRGTMLRPHAWGFTEFAIDEQYLSLGKVVLGRASGIFPDGALLAVGQGTESLSIDVEPGMTDKKVMLALPMAAEGGSESRDAGASGLSTRYIRTPVSVRDYNVYADRDSREEVIDCGRLDFSLMFEEDASLKGFVAMPVARVLECGRDGSVILDKEFLPTFLHVAASPVLAGYLREIIGLLAHRGDHLAFRVSNAGQTGSAELADFLLLQCINRMEPLFRHLDATRNVHPESFHVALLSLIGELSTFAEGKKRPRDLANYNHGDQRLTFINLMQHARHALSMVLEQHAVQLPMQTRQDNIKLVPVHDKKLLGTAVFILVALADMDRERLRSLLPKQVKIGTPENIRELVNSHVPGVKITPMPVAPRQIPFHAGKSYFMLEFSSKQRAQFETSTGCALHVSGAFPGLRMEIWAIKE